jgi:hypothetical protein
MFFLVAIAVGAGFGWFRSRDRDSDQPRPFRLLWLAPIAFAAQMLLLFGPFDLDATWSGVALLVAHALLLGIAVCNVRVAGIWAVTLGMTLNLVAMAANGGHMPVTPATLEAAGRIGTERVGDGIPGERVKQSKEIILRPEEIWFEPLTDRFWTGLPGRLGAIFSVGDVAILVGATRLAYVMARTARARRHHHQSPIAVDTVRVHV